jgi:RecB family exonuclease
MNDVPDSLPVDRLSGLRPEVWLSVGSGFAREEIKSLLLAQGRGFVGDAVLTLQEICLKVTGIKKETLLSSFSRQEILRELLSEPRIMEKMPELTRVKRQRNFLKRLDSTFQSARMAFAHVEEEDVYHERLTQTLGEQPLRNELHALSRAYETWLNTSGNYDLPILIRLATQSLRNEWPARVPQPQEIWCLSIQNPESLEKEFWEVMGHFVTIKQVSHLSSSWSSKPQISWQKWNTLDDAAESIAEQIAEKIKENPESLAQQAVLIPDVPSVRRGLNRALACRKIPLADPRDPTRLRWDETLKWALLPLEVVGSFYERQKVISWLHRFDSLPSFPKWVLEINQRGIRRGISSYSGGMLADVHTRLVELDQKLSGRKTAKEIADAHLALLKTEVGEDSQYFWLISFLESVWKGLIDDLSRVEQVGRKAALLFWLERFQTRLREVSPPVERLKPRIGVQIYRLQQAPMMPFQQIWIMGLPAHWLDGDGVGGYWLTDRDREILSTEFAVRSPDQVRDERLLALKSWIAGANEVVILDAHYEIDGRERESIIPVLKELETVIDVPIPSHASEMGAHARFSRSFHAIRQVPPQEVQLSSLMEFKDLKTGELPEITATAIDRYSRCSFQALGYHRWNLGDIREPDTELWPDVRGNILHEAVRLLLKSKLPTGGFSLSLSDALEKAWLDKRPKGLIRSRRVEDYVKAKLLVILEVFCEKEREFNQRSETHPKSLDDLTFKIYYPKFSIRGQPDRIDQHKDGLFVMDYKTSGTVPHGSDMLERGYRLQLPFYALAISQKLKQPVIGLQFVELDRKGSRRSGIFFKKWNGKTPGSLTQARSNSKSLVAIEPDDAWSILEDYLIQDAENYIQGKFHAQPRVDKREKECARCSLGDLCGFRRRNDQDSASGSTEGE